MNKIKRTVDGFTLVELLLATIILAIVLSGLIQLFLHCSVTTELSKNTTAAVSEAQGKMEEIRNTDFGSIVTNYHESWFDLTQLTGKGFVYVTTVQAELLEVEIVIGWENKYGRVVPEGLDLDSIIDTAVPSSDVSSASKVVSIATVVSQIADR